MSRKAIKKLNASRRKNQAIREEQVDEGKRLVQEISPAVLRQLVQREAIRRNLKR